VLKDGVASKDRRKIVGAFLYEDTISLLFSRTNYGKSLLAFQFAYAAATGSQFDPCEALCNDCEPMKTIVVDLELDHKTIADRHKHILKDPNPFLSNFIYFHEQLENPLLIGFDLLQRIEEVAITENAKFLVIDNISKLLPDAVKPETATMVITILNQIRVKTGATILVIGHTTKGNPSIAIQPGDYYGSAMIQNFFHELFYLDKTKDGNFFIANAKTKHKENFDQIVPVLFRGDHQRLGFGFTFCNLQNISDIQLPLALIQPKLTRKKPLTLCTREIQTLLSAGFSQADVALLCDVSRSAINHIINNT